MYGIWIDLWIAYDFDKSIFIAGTFYETVDKRLRL